MSPMNVVRGLLVRNLFGRRLLKNGFADRRAFRSVLEFIQSLTDHTYAEELEFLVDATTFDFLNVRWITPSTLAYDG